VKSKTLRLLHDPLRAAVDATPEKVAVVVDGQRYSYAQLLDTAQRLARALQEHGVTRGDRVAVFMENSWQAVVAIYATALAGGVLTVVNPQTKEDKLTFVLQDSDARALIADTELAEVFVPALDRAPGVRCLICSGVTQIAHAGVSFTEVVAGTNPSPRESGAIPIDLSMLIYTSGSTGQPKGVMMTHQSVLFAAASIAEYLRLGSDERILNVLPMAFDYGLYQLFLTVQVGGTLLLERSFAFPVPVLKRIEAEEATVVPVVPTIAATLVSLKRRTNWTLPSVRRVTNTAAALAPAFSTGLREIFPNALIFAMYGLTECKRVSYLEPEALAQKPTSVGRAIPGTEVFLRSPDGEPVPAGSPGILHVRGPHVMLGYWKQPELSAHMLKPGPTPGERVLCTHDVFRMDEDGDLYFIGRTDDVIKTRGEKVSPVEVENVLLRVPGIREAAVVGVPDEALGQAIRAFVVPEEGVALSEREVRRACAAALESFMVPRDIVFVDDLPKTESAKVRKRDLLRAPM
jgi:long-chain acyl-CoA synthetase